MLNRPAGQEPWGAGRPYSGRAGANAGGSSGERESGSMRGERVVIVGAGPAGVAAAVQCVRLGVTPRLFDRTGAAGGLVENAFSIENYPGLEGPLDGPGLVVKLRAHLARFGLGVERAEVTAITRDGDDFRVESGAGEVRARAVIVSSGTEPLRLGFPNEREYEGRTVFYDVRSLLRRHPRPREVVVAGGGEAACDYALTLSSAGAAVHMAVRSDRLKARGRLADAVRRAEAVQVSFETVCEGIRTLPTAVRLRGGARGMMEQSADALLVAVGRRSTAAGLLGSGNGPPPAGDESRRGLFIAGDARHGGLGQVGMAVGDGIRAATEAVSFMEDRA